MRLRQVPTSAYPRRTLTERRNTLSKTTLGFIFAGIIYLVLGVTLGVLFFIFPETRMLRPVHTHLNLVGFLTFLVFGIGYHILPRFRGNPLHSDYL